MRHGYEILRDPSDRYLVWDLVDDAPVVSANRIVTFPAFKETRAFLDILRNDATGEIHAIGEGRVAARGGAVQAFPAGR